MGAIEPLHRRLRDAREDAGLSQPELFRASRGIGYETIRGVEAPPTSRRHRYPSWRILRAYLRAARRDPREFDEYNLALARRALDEREVGYEAAMANLNRVREVLPLDDPPDEIQEAIDQADAGP